MNHTIYQRCDPAGRVLDQVTGATVTAVDATHVTIAAGPLAAAHIVPAAGDRLRGADGKWLTVTEAGEATGGAYPLTVAATGTK